MMEEAAKDFAIALEEGPGANERICVVAGEEEPERASLLGRFSREAKERGWLVLNETATPGFLSRISSKISDELSTQKEIPQENTYTLRNTLEEFLAYQSPRGVFVALDEVENGNPEEISQFAATIQHLVRQDAEIAVAIAGTPSAIKSLLSGYTADGQPRQTTFLRRSEKIVLTASN